MYQRFYCSRDWDSGVLCDSWTYNCARGVWLSHEGSEYTYKVDEATGGAVNYRGGKLREEKIKDKGKAYYVPLRRVDGTLLSDNFVGVTNTGTGEISGRTNLKNQAIYYDAPSKMLRSTLCDGCVRTFASQWPLKDNRELPIQFLIESEQRRSGNQLLYEYQWIPCTGVARGLRKQIWQIKTGDRTGQAIFARLGFDYSGIHQSDLRTIKASANDGREIVFSMQNHSIQIKRDLWERWYLTRVQRPNAPDVAYDYVAYRDWTRKQICSKTLADRLVQNIAYYRGGDNQVGDTCVKMAIDDWRDGKVSTLKAPIGSDASVLNTHRFFYTQGQTDVRDAVNHRTLYRYNNELRLNGIDHFTGTSDYRLYSAERFFWKDTNLICKALLYPDGVVRSGRYLEYDSKHNVIAEHMMGDLSGICGIGPEYTEGIPIWNGCECYTIRRTYTQDQYNRVASELLPNGLLTELRYVPDTHLVCAKLIKDRVKCLKREFHSYDSHGALIKIIADNGSGDSSDDTTDVSVRKITYITPHQGTPCHGLPEVIDEYFFDPATGEERPLGRIINTYSIEGWVTREEHYDAHFNLQYAICRDYDRYGNVILEQNALGQITQRRYDCFGNKLWEQGPDSSYHFEYVYDYANRLIAEERVCSDGARFNQTYRYDLLGNKIASFDIYGNETNFRYDAFGQVVETLYPACGEAGRLRATQEYDIAGNVTAITDVDGNTTRKTYNIRGQQTSILNPDGTIEHFEYNLNGTLHKQTAVNGLVTRLSYDLLGNCIRKEIFTPKGELLALTSAIYQGDTLLSETDANGNTTTYVHDGAGRPIAVHKPHTTIHYLYDALGRKAKTIEGQRVSVTEYDLLDRVIEERTEDLEGLVFTRTLYGYDAAGHRTTVTSFTDQGPSTTQSFYNAHGQIYRVVDAEGHETVTHHDYGFLNAYGQRVWHVTQVDALGKQTIKTYDTLGRVALVVHRDPFNQELSRTLSHYDGRGNLTKRTDTVKAEGYEDREVIAEWRYDALARIVEVVEGSGTPERRQTFYSYNRYGQKQNEILVDGTLLNYSYDAFGRIERYESSDGTFCYLYTYDPIGNLIRVDDTVNGTSTKRTYDSANRLIAETLGNGLTTSYQYDALGRLTQLSIPDGSRIVYTYDASSMRTVRRLDAAGNEIYSHAYLTYDLAGNLTSSKMIGEAGEILFKRDQLSRVRELKTDAFRETIPPGGYDAVGNLLTKTRHDAAGDVPCSFGYDARYQIASETGQAAHTYRYDSLDNRLVKDQEICEIDALNQLVRHGERRFAYGQRGNRTQSEKTHYAYDALGRLTEVTSEDTRFVYTYDSFNCFLLTKSRLVRTLYP